MKISGFVVIVTLTWLSFLAMQQSFFFHTTVTSFHARERMSGTHTRERMSGTHATNWQEPSGYNAALPEHIARPWCASAGPTSPAHSWPQLTYYLAGKKCRCLQKNWHTFTSDLRSLRPTFTEHSVDYRLPVYKAIGSGNSSPFPHQLV